MRTDRTSATFACALPREARLAKRHGRTIVVGLKCRNGVPQEEVIAYGYACSLREDWRPGTLVEVPFQEAGEQAMGRFRVVAFNRETKHGGDGHTIEQQTYTVDAPASGRERIPPFRMTIAGGKPSAGSTPGSASASASKGSISRC